MTFTKHFTLLLFCLAVSAVTVAQPSEKRVSSLSRLLHKHVYQGEYERPALKVEAPTDARRAKNALGAPFNECVWFPGEWEEVKAVVVTARYEYRVPGHENDKRYAADQIVKISITRKMNNPQLSFSERNPVSREWMLRL